MNPVQHLSQLAMLPNTDWRSLGDIVGRHSNDGELVVLNYTAAAQYANRWNAYERVCRGLILSTKTGEVVARPFDKFHNWGDDTYSPKAHLVDVTEKVDGSLGILFRCNGRYCIATRGSFDSEQALWATEFFNRQWGWVTIPEQLTLLFEIIYPANRVVIDYGSLETLLLIGVRNRRTGADWFFKHVRELARDYNFQTPRSLDATDPYTIVHMAETLPASQEGWVLRFSDGSRFKVKGNAYRELHRLRFMFSEQRVLEAVQQGTADEYISLLPDDMQPQALDYQRNIVAKITAVQERVAMEFAQTPTSSRRDFALWVLGNYPQDQHYLFAMLDSRDIVPFIIKTEF